MADLGMYTLDEHGNPRKETKTLAWAKWLEANSESRVVKQESIGNARISTVFLGLDYNFLLKGPPLLYESLVFGGEYNGEMRRYSTRAEAEAGHRELVDLIKEGAVTED